MKDGITLRFSAAKTQAHVASTVERALKCDPNGLADARSNGKSISCRRPAALFRSSALSGCSTSTRRKPLSDRPPRGTRHSQRCRPTLHSRDFLRPPYLSPPETRHLVEIVTDNDWRVSQGETYLIRFAYCWFTTIHGLVGGSVVSWLK